MTSGLKEASKNPKTTKKATQKSKFSHEDLIEAVKKVSDSRKGRADIKYLWTTDSVHRFRVNYWKDNAIVSSDFVHVKEGKRLTARIKE